MKSCCIEEMQYKIHCINFNVMKTAAYIIDSIPIRIIATEEVKALYPGNCEFTKDFCIVPPVPGLTNEWIGYGSGGTSDTEEWLNLRVTADNPYGPFTLQKPTMLLDKNGNNFTGPQLCAPSVSYDTEEKAYYMTIQEACFEVRRDIHIFRSTDGEVFHHQKSVFSDKMELPHQGAYDPEHSELKIRNERGNVIGKRKVCVYTGINKVSMGSIYLIESTSNNWDGPWKFVSRIYGSEQATSHHNKDDDPTREWCTEGEQLFELDEELVSGDVYAQYGNTPIILLNYVGFYPHSYSGNVLDNGTRQHNAFCAIKHSDFEKFFNEEIEEKPVFRDLGPIHRYSSFRETGHGTLRALPGRKLGLYRQERDFNPETKQSGPCAMLLILLIQINCILRRWNL